MGTIPLVRNVVIDQFFHLICLTSQLSVLVLQIRVFRFVKGDNVTMPKMMPSGSQIGPQYEKRIVRKKNIHH